MDFDPRADEKKKEPAIVSTSSSIPEVLFCFIVLIFC